MDEEEKAVHAFKLSQNELNAEVERMRRLKWFGAGNPGAQQRPDTSRVLHLDHAGAHARRELTRHHEKKKLIEEAQRKAYEVVPSLRVERKKSFV